MNFSNDPDAKIQTKFTQRLALTQIGLRRGLVGVLFGSFLAGVAKNGLLP